MDTTGSLALRFLGVGNAQAVELGSAAAVLERDGAPLLLIDCGQEALSAYLERYASVPMALFLTQLQAADDSARADVLGSALQAEFALQGGDLETAARGYADAAVASDQVQLIERAAMSSSDRPVSISALNARNWSSG